MFTIFKVKDNEYKLRLSAKSSIELEKRLRTNPVNVFTVMREEKLPNLEHLLIMLHCSLKDFQSNITQDNVYEIWDSYVEDGGNIQSLMEVLSDVFIESGFIPKDNDPNVQ